MAQVIIEECPQLKSRLLATVTMALVLVTASACANPGPAGQPMEKMTPAPNAMDQGNTLPKGEMMNDATMTKPETIKEGDAMMTHPDAMMEGEAMPEEGAMLGGGSAMMPAAGVVEGESIANDEPGMMKPESGADTQSSIKPRDRYVSYSPDALASALQHGRAVLFFRADWCPTCRAADAAFKANLENIPGDVTILAVNYDRESALKKTYNITYQHTFVQVDGSGKRLSRWSGGDVRELLANVQ